MALHTKLHSRFLGEKDIPAHKRLLDEKLQAQTYVYPISIRVTSYDVKFFKSLEIWSMQTLLVCWMCWLKITAYTVQYHRVQPLEASLGIDKYKYNVLTMHALSTIFPHNPLSSSSSLTYKYSLTKKFKCWTTFRLIYFYVIKISYFPEVHFM